MCGQKLDQTYCQDEDKIEHDENVLGETRTLCHR